MSKQKWDVDIYRDPERYVTGLGTYLEDGNEVAVIFTVQRLSLLKGYGAYLGHYGAGGPEFMCLSSGDKGRAWHQRALPEGISVTKRVRGLGHKIAMPDGTLIQWTGGNRFSKFRDDLQGLLNVQLLVDGETWAGRSPLSYIISTDGGETWSQSVKLDTSPYPGAALWQMILLKDGSLLASFAAPDGRSIFFMSSPDMGKTWSFKACIPPPRGITFYEGGIVQTDTGRIICMIRAHLPVPEGQEPGAGLSTYIYQSQSDDGGATWTEPKETDLWGHPAQLMVLKSGRILCAYGHRKLPFGIRVAYSEDDGENWREKILRVDGCNRDLGYPCSVQLEDDTIFTAYYFNEGVVDTRRKPTNYYTYAAGSFYTEQWLTS